MPAGLFSRIEPSGGHPASDPPGSCHREEEMQRHVMVGLSLTLAACDAEVPTPPPMDHSAHVASAALGPSDLATLRQVTAPFHNFKQARKAGWNAQTTSCFSSAEGGMGFHYGNPGLIDGAVAVNQPELLLYEPQKNGQLRLVAVEYIVPRQAWPGPGCRACSARLSRRMKPSICTPCTSGYGTRMPPGSSGTGIRKFPASSPIRLTLTSRMVG